MEKVKNELVEVLASEIKTKEGKSFIGFKAIVKGGKKVDLRFTKEVKGIPTKAGHYTIEIPVVKMNLDKSRKYPIIWVKEIVEVNEHKYEEKIDEDLVSLFE